MDRTAKIADIDEMMYSCGLEVLHPGGIEKTDEMARMCNVAEGKEVLDIGAGKGATACHLAQKYQCRVVGVDLSRRMIQDARERARERGLQDRVRFERADAHSLPFEDESFDIVLAECTSVLLDKEKALSELVRVAKSGGYVGDLEMTWREAPPPEAVDELYRVWEGFSTMTLEQWKDLFAGLGLVEVKAVDFSEAIPDMEKSMKKELGLTGKLKMLWKLLLRADLRRAMRQYREVFERYGRYLGYGYVVGRKQ